MNLNAISGNGEMSGGINTINGVDAFANRSTIHSHGGGGEFHLTRKRMPGSPTRSDEFISAQTDCTTKKQKMDHLLNVAGIVSSSSETLPNNNIIVEQSYNSGTTNNINTNNNNGVGAGMIGTTDYPILHSSSATVSTGLPVTDDTSTISASIDYTQLNKAPLFLQKTYKMIEESNPELAEWTNNGEMFVVKDPDKFAEQMISQYFDHSNFLSFTRQLNFYGFSRLQSKPIRRSDFDETTSKHVTYYNENFQRGRFDLLLKIQRTTKGGGASNAIKLAQHGEIESLKFHVGSLKKDVEDLTEKNKELNCRLQMNERFMGQMHEYGSRIKYLEMMVEQQQRQLSNLLNISGTVTMPKLDACGSTPNNNPNSIENTSAAQNLTEAVPPVIETTTAFPPKNQPIAENQPAPNNPTAEVRSLGRGTVRGVNLGVTRFSSQGKW